MSAGLAIVGTAAEAQWVHVLRDPEVDPSLRALTGRLCVPRDLPVFAGHFPAMPIVPGVVQLGWVVELARLHGLVSGPLLGIVSAKFRRILRPGMDLRVRLERGRSQGELQFEFKAGEFVVSCGRLRFGSDP